MGLYLKDSLKFAQVVFGPMKKAGLLLKVIVALCRITALANSRARAHVLAKESVFKGVLWELSFNPCIGRCVK